MSESVAYGSRFAAFPPRSGGAIRSFEIVRSLRALGFDAVLISAAPEQPEEEAAPEWLRLFDARVTPLGRLRRKAIALQVGLPWRASPGVSAAFSLELARARAEGRRLIVAGDAGIANVPSAAWAETIVDSHDLELIRAPRLMGSGLGSRADVVRARRFAIRSLRRSRAFLVCSELERGTALAAVPEANVQVLPNGISARTISPVPEEPRAYFVGKLDYAPNYEGLQWLTTEVWPLVRRELPGAELLVAGSGALPPAVAATVASSSGVSLLGEVDSIDELQRRARVALVPILTGGGTRLKLLEACAGGRAIVTTPVGGEGLELPGFVAVAGTPAGFAQETVRRLRDRALVEREGRALADWVSDKRWDVLVEQTLVPLLRGARAAAAERG